MSIVLAVVNGSVLLASHTISKNSIISNPVNVLTVTIITIIIISLSQVRNGSFTRSTVEAIKALTLGFATFYIIAFIYGAYLIQNFYQNATWALWMSTLTILPTTLSLGPLISSKENWILVFRERHFSNSNQAILFYGTVGLLVGNWFGCIVIPLDWGRVWQKWPVPNVILGSIGYLIGAFFGALLNFTPHNSHQSSSREGRATTTKILQVGSGGVGKKLSSSSPPPTARKKSSRATSIVVPKVIPIVSIKPRETTITSSPRKGIPIVSLTTPSKAITQTTNPLTYQAASSPKTSPSSKSKQR